MLYFAKKCDVVKLTKVEKKFTLNTPFGDQYGEVGDYIATDLYSNQRLVTKDELEDMVRVNYWRIENYRNMYENNAASMSELSNTEDESFIVNNTYEQIQERLSK